MDLKKHIRSIPDYPKKGILFRDITTLIKDPKAFKFTNDKIIELSKKLDFEVSFFQSNSEAKIIDKIQECNYCDGLIVNAGAFTHTSIAIHDALKILKIPKIEIHISNIYSREEFRKKSFISPAVHGIIAGFGIDVYILALRSLKYLFKNE